MDTNFNNTEPYICNCELCQKLGPLYASMHKNNGSLTSENSINLDNKKELLNKNNVMNIVCIIFIIIFLLISSKFYII